jgi:cyanophycin synthetase
MSQMLEPQKKHSNCIYCGDAYVPHTLYYVMSLLSVTFDNHIIKTTRHAPDFVRRFVDWLLLAFFEVGIFIGICKISDDIDKAKTFRSRVMWEEARRRGIDVKQIIMFGKPIDQYRMRQGGKLIYFDSLPIPSELLMMKSNWDDKFLLKNELVKNNIPVPNYFTFPAFLPHDTNKIFYKLKKPLIVKPRVGSRGRHTVTNIRTLEQFEKAIDVAKELCAYLSVEEHMFGDVCRATFVNGKLMGFYQGGTPFVVGDGVKTIEQLILDKDANRQARVEKVQVNQEVRDFVARFGFQMEDVLPKDIRLPLTYRTGRLYGGVTREMLDELHPSFVPTLTKAAEIVGLPVIGFDCIVPDPTADASTQRWGIIECNTLPFIDLHYYALEGKPKNIAGAIWDFWN